jgi:lysophospholipase L1-like esterase
MMRAYRRTSTVQQMSVSLVVFVVLIVLLDSGGLYDWASRLELGSERRVALPAAAWVHRVLAPLGIEKERRHGLVELARVGWSDDPEALAAAHPVVASKPVAVARVAIATVVPAPVVVPRPARRLVLEGAPPIWSVLPKIPAIKSEETRTVALAGDSMMAVGLSPAMLQQAPQYKDLAFLKLFKSGTGLARPEVFNWELEYPAMLKDERPDFILVAIGANDGQGFVEDGVTHPFGTAEWQRIYAERADAYLQMLEAEGATVVWLGLPPMKDGMLDDRIALINRIDYSVVSASPHAIWYSTAGLVGDGNGRFRDFGEVDGRTARLRQGDGIHLSTDGAALIAAKLLPWLAAAQPVVVDVGKK